MDHKLIGVKELAEILGVPMSWVYARTRETGKGTIPRVRVGKYVKFKIDEVMDWLKKKYEAGQC
jgi:excisionase family DNA binding protein